MSAQRKKVLEMLAEGKITTKEAEKLLDKLTGSSSDQTSWEKTEAGSASEAKKQRYLRIVVDLSAFAAMRDKELAEAIENY